MVHRDGKATCAPASEFSIRRQKRLRCCVLLLQLRHMQRSIHETNSLYRQPESQQIHVWSLNHLAVADAGAGRGCAFRSGSATGGQPSGYKRYLYVGVRPELQIPAYRIALMMAR